MMNEIIFMRRPDGSFLRAGELSTTHGRFQWFDEGRWTGGWAIEPLEDLLARMTRNGPYKYGQYRIVPATKPPLSIEPCCGSCGLAADYARTYLVTERDSPITPLTQDDIDRLNYRYPNGKRAYSEAYVQSVLDKWTGDKWIGSPFYGGMFGQTVQCCDYVIDPDVKNAGHDAPGFAVNKHGLISVEGFPGQFCSVYCLAMGMFLYRNRRCAGCAELLPKKEWTSPEKFRGGNYPKYRYCSDACKNRWKDNPIMSTEHVRCVLGMLPTLPKQSKQRKKRNPNLAYLQRLSNDLPVNKVPF